MRSLERIVASRYWHDVRPSVWDGRALW